MKGRLWTAVVGVLVATALILVPSALAAYTSAKLEVRQVGQATAFKITQSSSEDAVASVRLAVPTGTTVTTSQAPGTVLGKAKALLKLLGFAGAEVPVEGNVVVAAPGQIPAATQQACLQGATPLATWLLAVEVASTPIALPVFLVSSAGSPLAPLGPAYIAACFSSPYLTPEQGGTTGQPQVVNVEFSVTGVFSPVTLGAFVAIMTPYVPGTGTINAPGTIAAPAAVAPGAVTLAAKKLRKGTRLAGRVTQGGQGRGGATVTIFGGATAKKLKRIGRTKVAANGAFTFKAKAGTFFRATAVATGAAAPPLCAQYSQLPYTCVNPTVSGFTAQSTTVRKK